MATDVYEGKIKKLIPKGYGFLSIPGREKEVFFHAAGLVEGNSFNNLKEGDKVEFDGIENTPKGDMAYGNRIIY